MKNNTEILINNKFDQFNDFHQNAMDFIRSALTDDGKWSDVRGIVKWMLATDANPYSYLKEPWSIKTCNAEGFASLIHHIRHALYDDGACTIVTVNKEPRILFHYGSPNLKELALSDTEKNMEEHMKPLREEFGMEGEQYEIKVLDINLNDFGQHYDAYYETKIKEWFTWDAERHGVEFATKHYSEYQLFKPEWITEFKNTKAE